jgi:type IV pilus assembly protein PilC
LDALLLRLPIFGPIVYQTLVSRLARSLATLVSSGVPILEALGMASDIAGNAVVAREMSRVRQAVERGERISIALEIGKWFQPDVIQMVRAGEDSGRLDIMLDKVADFYDRRVNFTLKQLTTLLEPFLLLVMGGIIALIMASLLMPMFDMVRVLNRGGLR